MSKLTAGARNALPNSAFAGPDRSYPIENASHARNALARASQHAPASLKAKIKAKVKKKFPDIHVEGQKRDRMGQPIVFSRTLAASNATAIAASQSPGTAVVTLNGSLATGGVATLDTQRRAVLVSGGNDSSINFTVFGTNDAGFPIQDTITGGNATASVTNLDFKTITSITHSGTVASTLTVGTGNTGSSLWQIINWNATPSNVGVLVEARSGTANFTIQYTFDDPNILPGTGGLNAAGLAYPLGLNLATITNQTATIDASFVTPFVAFRLLTNSGTGTLVCRALQAGLASP